jgi:hypothetical protein
MHRGGTDPLLKNNLGKVTDRRLLVSEMGNTESACAGSPRPAPACQPHPAPLPEPAAPVLPRLAGADGVTDARSALLSDVALGALNQRVRPRGPCFTLGHASSRSCTDFLSPPLASARLPCERAAAAAPAGSMPRLRSAAPARATRPEPAAGRRSEKDAKLAQKMGQLQRFLAVLPQ